jgi:hypothetical protein
VISLAGKMLLGFLKEKRGKKVRYKRTSFFPGKSALIYLGDKSSYFHLREFLRE